MLRSARSFSSSGVRAEKAKVSYSKTLLLPKTAFSPKLPNDEERSKLIHQSGKNVFAWQKNRNDHGDEFTLHDGPPYANGDLHLGHALNKILKDIVNRFELIHNNSLVNYTPGWDCHGLPIEMKAVGEAGKLSAVEVREKCRELAQSMMEKQKEQYLDFGIMTDFDQRYVTMSHSYEVAQLKVFLKLFQNGLLSRQLKPVWWGCETQTALAEAELEYNPQHKSVAIYVKFPLTQSQLTEKLGGDVKLLIWTSTAWTIPANKAICINRSLTYTALKNQESGEIVIVAKDLADAVLALVPNYDRLPVQISGSELEGLSYSNPSADSSESFPVLHGDHVSSTAGTGLVHNAPAHGMEDFTIGKQNSLNSASSVDGKGLYIGDNIPKGFQALAGRYANGKSSITKVLEILHANHMLFKVNKAYTHSYPYDWRSKTPVIQRATPQWFVNVEKIKETALQALDNVDFIPEAGRNRLSAFVKNRSEWCISRQRSWGVPLPIIYHKDSHEPIEELKVIQHLVFKIEEFGTDAWFVEEQDISRWLPREMDGSKFYKGKDTMDVWFDSGTSWASLKKGDMALESSEPLADVYLEGSDQHRGWFQSSLLNKVIASGTDGHFKPVAPFKKIITHGFTLDKQNNKMSKSMGNVISPLQIIKGGGKPLVPALGTDGLRLWVASSNFTSDINVTPEVLNRVSENVKKLRVTFKYLLGNLQDYEKPLEYEQLSTLDKWVLSRLHTLEKSVVDAYKNHNYARVVREVNSHMSSDLSALYFDISKDCLYTGAQNSVRRRGIQTVLEQVCKTYIALLAPIKPLLTQEVWSLLRTAEQAESPFMMPWSYFSVPEKFHNAEIEHEMEQIWQLRDSLYKALELLRLEGKFKNKLELEVSIAASGEEAKVLERHREFLDDYLLVSKVHLGEKDSEALSEFSSVFLNGEVNGQIRHSTSCKCPRCWKYVSETEDVLCKKCEDVTCT